MKPRLFYITRTYPPQKSGGALMRAHTVKLLKEHFEVTTVHPAYNTNIIIDTNETLAVPFPGNIKTQLLYERIGINEDYLDIWIELVYPILLDRIDKNSILFATSGGELGTFKLASKLKTRIGCHYVANTRDPLSYSYVNGLRKNGLPHVRREKYEEKYLGNADLIVTSSRSQRASLINKYPYLKQKIKSNYFGYTETIEVIPKTKSEILRIAYIGNMSETQSPEILAELIRDDMGIVAFFIGDTSRIQKLIGTQENVNYLDFMPPEEMRKFLTRDIDIGFLSLKATYYGVCVPSKLYEYINLELPILAAVPDGDGKNIINNREYGIAVDYHDTVSLGNAIMKFKEAEFRKKVSRNLRAERNEWSMTETIKDVIRDINSLT